MELIEGEDPLSEDVIVARHWEEVYSRLIDFTRRTQSQRPGQAAALTGRLERYRELLTFWNARVWHLEEVVIDETARTVDNWSGSIALTRREFQILRLMLGSPGRSFSARNLLLDAWHDAALPEEAVRSYVSRIRNKLEGIDLAQIVTDPAGGYRLVLSPRLQWMPEANAVVSILAQPGYRLSVGAGGGPRGLVLRGGGTRNEEKIHSQHRPG
ncbi:MAG: winged helix-turn-helix domain-containing protein, partial [Candidatus Dormibacteria bacterium]